MVGRNLGLGVVAEGIEERDQYKKLRELGCREGQGFLFMKPAPARLLDGRLLTVPEVLQSPGRWPRKPARPYSAPGHFANRAMGPAQGRSD
jgi:predicted signal transduction protein with EAL and GGDEF domain